MNFKYKFVSSHLFHCRPSGPLLALAFSANAMRWGSFIYRDGPVSITLALWVAIMHANCVAFTWNSFSSVRRRLLTTRIASRHGRPSSSRPDGLIRGERHPQLRGFVSEVG